MNYGARMIGGTVALLLFGCAHHGNLDGAEKGTSAKYVGGSPAGAWAREFLGGLTKNAECHSIAWQLTLTANRNDARGTYELAALYHVPSRSNTNQSEEGPKVALRGEWEIVKDSKPKAGSVIYRFHAQRPTRSLSFVKISDGLLHLLNPDGSLAIGTGGWSYTLNRAERAETAVNASLAMSAPDMSYRIAPKATGLAVFGVFEGRTPCHGISRELKLSQHAGCTKAKWRVTLFQNPGTSAPTTYKVEGTLFRQHPREGTWSASRGVKNDADAMVYQLNAVNQPELLLMRGDDNVLFFLDRQRELMVGHGDFSYTLNRVIGK